MHGNVLSANIKHRSNKKTSKWILYTYEPEKKNGSTLMMSAESGGKRSSRTSTVGEKKLWREMGDGGESQ